MSSENRHPLDPLSADEIRQAAAILRRDHGVTDGVLWYGFGIHHITRPEEWPVMSVDVVSFWLKPVGFFDRDPGLDVPPSHQHCQSEEG